VEEKQNENIYVKENKMKNKVTFYTINMPHTSFFPAWSGNFSLHHRVQNGSGAHPASYPMGTRGSFPAGKAAGA
jgi:hypothetical protein